HWRLIVVMEEIIRLDKVSYIRDGRYILKDLSWTVNRGEHWVLLGPNGSGKTTTLNMVNGYIFPSEGKVKVLDCEFGHSSIIDLRKKIGWVSSALSQFIPANDYPQDNVQRIIVGRKKIGWVSSALSQFIPANDYPLHIVLSGKFASLGLWEKVDDEDVSRAREILALLKIEHLADRQYRMLSQGEKQKVLIGRALMNHPDIIIFDEAFNGLDIFARRDIEETINELADRQITFILVTHNTDEILPIFGKALLIKEGQVHSVGDIDDMIAYENLTDFYGEEVEVFKHKDRFYLSLAAKN
ncbi:MAG: ATP-binding cassette domain-containing protein, partial [Peptococcaceae bacterium]|nr:ATP-binding cassette domain-containing protein [Peptococcaceae bacterium]